MAQLSLRVPDPLAARLRTTAQLEGISVNAWINTVLSAALDPDLERDEVRRVRQRLAEAGLLATPTPLAWEGPAEEAVRAARQEAGRGQLLADYVAQGR